MQQPKVDFESETALLKEIQAGHVNSMRRSGLLSKALQAAGISEEGLINPVLYKVNVRDTSGQAVTNVELRLSGTNERGVMVPRFVPVTESIGSLVLPREPFTPEDAESVQAMMNGLTDAKDLGLLPHLSPTMDHITNPYTGLARAPQPPVDSP